MDGTVEDVLWIGQWLWVKILFGKGVAWYGARFDKDRKQRIPVSNSEMEIARFELQNTIGKPVNVAYRREAADAE